MSALTKAQQFSICSTVGARCQHQIKSCLRWKVSVWDGGRKNCKISDKTDDSHWQLFSILFSVVMISENVAAPSARRR